MKRNMILGIRLTSDEHDLLTVCAHMAGRSRGALLRSLLQRAVASGDLGAVPPQSEAKQAEVRA
jgi:hypothetical protein